MAAAQPPVNPWPPEPVHPPGYLSRKALPIKREDGDALTRRDIQYDLLHAIFSNEQKVFTSPLPGKSAKVNFSELYISALKSSSKCSKVLKDKMTETPAFALELAKLSLLTNVGRINTTMAFFPEMRTALRTYHPVPSLQKTDGNAQDAPRIKNCLKAALLSFEQNSPPSTPEEILTKRNEGQRPPTSIVNLVFVISNHASPLAGVHFDNNINFLDLFLPKKFHSGDRAKAFLWHIYHYMEDSEGPNPFDDDFARHHPGKAPQLRTLSDQDWTRENVDTVNETEWGYRMKIVRINFLRTLMASNAGGERRPKNAAPHFVSAVPGPDSAVTVPPPAIVPGVPLTRRPRSRIPQDTREDNQFMYYVPGANREQPPPQPQQQMRPTVIVEPPPPPSARMAHPAQGSMLQHAWRQILSGRDALEDSDEEDEEVRRDHARRREILNNVAEFVPHPPSSPFSFSSDSEPDHDTDPRHRDNTRLHDHRNHSKSDSSDMSADEGEYEGRGTHPTPSTLSVPPSAPPTTRGSSQHRQNDETLRNRDRDRDAQPSNIQAGTSRSGR